MSASATPSFIGSLTRVGVLLAATMISVSAQDALRESVAGERNAVRRRRALEQTPTNLRLGDLRLLVQGRFETELNDNINVSRSNPQEDVIFRTGLSTFSLWPLTPANALSISLEFGYAKYLQNPQYDRMFVHPGSEFSFDAVFDQLRVNFHDRFSYTQSPISEPSLSGVADYGGFHNTAGISVDRDFENARATFGYDHGTFISATRQFDYLNRNSEFLVARLAFYPTEAWTTGVEATGGYTYYNEPLLSDSFNLSAGLFGVYQLSEYLEVRPRLGYTAYFFEENRPGASSEAGSYYFQLDLNHRLNRILSYSVEAGKEFHLGTVSELSEIWYARARADWNLIRDVGIGTFASIEHGSEEGPTRLRVDETFDRLGGGIAMTYRLAEKLRAGLSYEVYSKQSDVELLSYVQNRVTLSFTYSF